MDRNFTNSSSKFCNQHMKYRNSYYIETRKKVCLHCRLPDFCRKTLSKPNMLNSYITGENSNTPLYYGSLQHLVGKQTVTHFGSVLNDIQETLVFNSLKKCSIVFLSLVYLIKNNSLFLQNIL